MTHFDVSKATDTQLLIRFEDGRDQRAFAEIVRRHGPMVLATARRVLPSQDDAYDAFQAAFFALAKSVGKLRNKEAVAGWLHQAAHSCAMNIRNANGRWHGKSERMTERLKGSGSSEQNSNKTDPSLSVANEELKTIIDEELARLPPKLQTAIVLCDLEGLRQNQIAAKLGIAVSTVRDRIAKGRQLLRDRLVRRGVSLSLAGIIGGLSTSGEASAAITSALVADTTAKATLFAAGKTAAEIGVASSVFQSANQVISAMTKAKLITVGLMAIAILALMGTLSGLVGTQANMALGGTVFNETFDDGNFSDGSPVRWVVNSDFFPGIVDASSGELVISPLENAAPDSVVGVDALDVTLRDTSIRSRMRVTETGGAITVVTRARSSSTRVPYSAYFAGVAYLPEFGGSVVLAGRNDNFGEDVVNRVFYPTVSGDVGIFLPYDVREEDTEIRFDMVDDSYKLWVWRANGGSMPTEPQFDIVDNTNAEAGFVALVMSNNPPGTATSSGIVDFIEVSQPVPEPSTAALGILAVVALLGVRSHRRRFLVAS